MDNPLINIDTIPVFKFDKNGNDTIHVSCYSKILYFIGNYNFEGLIIPNFKRTEFEPLFEISLGTFKYFFFRRKVWKNKYY